MKTNIAFLRCKMVFLFFLFFSTSSTNLLFAQPATLPWTENFSSSTNDWTLLKWSASSNNPNNWHIGNAAGNSAPGLYISNDGGVSNTYSYLGGQPSYLWAVREITFPNTTSDFILNFDWRCLGYDVPFGAVKAAYFRVWLVPASFTPTYSQITSASGGVQFGGNFHGNESNWLTETFAIPSSFAGGTYKLIFEWYNSTTNNPTPNNPPAGIDNISISLATPPPPTVSAIDVYTVGNIPADITTNAGALQLAAEILPANVNQAVTWSLVPVTGTATISTSGLVTAQTNGTVWGKATSVQDPSFSDSILITISNQIVPILSLEVSTYGNVPATINTNGGTRQMTTTILPNTANQNVLWSIIPETGFATISSAGLVTAQTNGTVWAKAVSVQDASKLDSLLITISNQTTPPEPITSVEVTTQGDIPATITTNNGTLQLMATILPSTANQDVYWSITPGSGAADITSTGLVSAQEDGTVWAKAISVQDANQLDSLQILITNQDGIGIKDITFKNSVNVFPVPFSDVLNVSFSNNGYKGAKIIVHNVSGELVYNNLILNQESRHNLYNLASGNYFVTIISPNGQKVSFEVIKA